MLVECTTRQAADLLHISPETLRRWERNQQIPFYSHRTPGGHRRYNRQEVLDYLKIQRAKKQNEVSFEEGSLRNFSSGSCSDNLNDSSFSDLEQVKPSNSHSVIVGSLDSDIRYAAKLKMLRALRDGQKVIALETKSELTELPQSNEGQYISIARDSAHNINIMDFSTAAQS